MPETLIKATYKSVINIELSLWYLYKSPLTSENNKIEIRNYLLERYYYLALKLSKIFFKKLGGTIPEEEVLSNSLMGLVSAIQRYDFRKCDSFEKFATIRIKGEIMDGLKEITRYSKRTSYHLRMIKKAEEELSSLLGRKPRQKEVISHIGISKKVFDNAIRQSSLIRPIYLDDTTNNKKFDISTDRSPEKIYIVNETKKIVNEAIETLPEIEKNTIKMYFYDNLNSTEIAELINLSSSRVRQIIEKAKKRLKPLLEKLL